MAPDIETISVNPMKIDAFLKVPDIPGESVRDGHEDEMEVFGVEFDMVAPHDANTLSRRGRVSLSTIKFRKHYDIGTVYLKQACFQNKLFDEVVFSARRTIEGETADYLVITLEEASVVSYSMKPSFSDPDLLEEVVAFAFKKIIFKYADSHETEMDVHVGK
jgi:type VI secretion system secreted protein Hcp